MTLAKSALNVFIRIDCPERKLISKIFFEKWKNNSVVLDNWFAYSASIETAKKNEDIEALFENEYFDLKSPNTLRSILNAYATRNSLFHAIDGTGYKYIAKLIIKFDKQNPIIISRFSKIFSNYKNYTEPYKSNMLEVLRYICGKKLSTNTREVVDAIIDG